MLFTTDEWDEAPSSRPYLKFKVERFRQTVCEICFVVSVFRVVVQFDGKYNAVFAFIKCTVVGLFIDPVDFVIKNSFNLSSRWIVLAAGFKNVVFQHRHTCWKVVCIERKLFIVFIWEDVNPRFFINFITLVSDVEEG